MVALSALGGVMPLCMSAAADLAPADAYTTKGGILAKRTYGLSLGYLSGKAGETGFGSKTTAAEVGTGTGKAAGARVPRP